jgi:hypothetical protein
VRIISSHDSQISEGYAEQGRDSGKDAKPLAIDDDDFDKMIAGVTAADLRLR